MTTEKVLMFIFLGVNIFLTSILFASNVDMTPAEVIILLLLMVDIYALGIVVEKTADD